ncbi:hypothetical protein BH10CYA1_BH10CYA1_32430 [soil metagenome]
MYCNSCENASSKGKLVSVKVTSIVKMSGIDQCDNCKCAISRTGFAVIPQGKRPMTRNMRILERRGRRELLGF